MLIENLDLKKVYKGRFVAESGSFKNLPEIVDATVMEKPVFVNFIGIGSYYAKIDKVVIKRNDGKVMAKVYGTFVKDGY